MTDQITSQKAVFRNILVALIVLCIIISWIGVVDSKTEQYVDDSIIKATVAYGSARALNAAISVAQSAQVGVNLGAEASFHPLEILDPVNDMVEDYATVMKYSIGSLIIQKILVEILANNLFKWLMLGVGILLIVSLLFFNGIYASGFSKAFLFITLIRFMFVMTVLLSTFVDATYLQEQTTQQMDVVDQAIKGVGFTNTANADISPEQRIEIIQKIQDLQSQQNKLTKQIQEQSEVVSSAQYNMEKDKEKLKGIKSAKGIVERFNPLSDDDEIKSAEKTFDRSRGVYSSEEKTQEELTDKFEILQDSIVEQQKILQGDNGFFTGIKKKMAAAHSLFSTEKISQTLEDSIKAMLNLIALFVFKTLIMPIVFLLLILRSFKWVWGYDPRTLLKSSIHE